MPRKSQFASHKKYLEYYRKYRQTEKWKEYRRKHQKEWRRKNTTNKDRVRLKVLKALRFGIIKKGCCEICKTKINIEAHHTDYRKPLQVTWLCRKHHIEIHRK